MKKRTLLFIFSALIVLCLIGCGNQVDSNPGEVTSSFLTALQHQDYSSVKQYYAENVDNFPNFKNKVEDISPKVANELFSKMADFSYTVEKVSIDPNDASKATVTVTFRCYDLGKTFESILLDYLEKDLTMTFNGAKDDEITQQAETVIIDNLSQSKQDFNRTVPITLTLEDNVWKVDKLDNNPDLMNALSGNILYTIRDMMNSIQDGSTTTDTSSSTNTATQNNAS
nr:hypothetical protein [uncultured Cellulosilyticum sp.]